MFKLFKKKTKTNVVRPKASKEVVEMYRDIIETKSLNSIRVNLDFHSSNKIKKGSSKIGGKPDLPSEFDWFYYQGASLFTDEVANRPLEFIAQFNLNELSKYDIDKRLPNKGMLYFFYEGESGTWGFDPKDKGAAKVFYYDGCIEDLTQENYPKGLGSERLNPQIALTFSSELSAPMVEEAIRENPFEFYEEYDKIIEEKRIRTDLEQSFKLLGYSDNIQGDITRDCQLCSNGVYTGDSREQNQDLINELLKDKDQWKLLFQMDSIEEEGVQFYFGSFGRLYFYIREKDLENQNFNNTWFAVQCT